MESAGKWFCVQCESYSMACMLWTYRNRGGGLRYEGGLLDVDGNMGSPGRANLYHF